jgi:hypothetical protein
MVHHRPSFDLVNTGGNKQIIKLIGNRVYIAMKGTPEKIHYTLFNLRGRAVHRKTVYNRRSFVLPENHISSGLRILSLAVKDINGYKNTYFLKLSDIK